MKRAVVWCFALVLAGCGKDHELASVNGRTISADDFRTRYKQYLTESGVRDNIKLRKQVLANMVNEVLILDQVQRRGLLDDSAGRKRLQELRTQALLTV